MKPRKLRPPEERFWARVDKAAPGGCWQWQGAVVRGGYAHFKHDRGAMGHRFAYEALVGPIPEGLTLDHLCKNTRCVNPEHLEPVTMRVNLLRGSGFPGRNSRKTHCPKGHPYSGANLFFSKDGRRKCRACNIARLRRRRLHRKQEAAA